MKTTISKGIPITESGTKTTIDFSHNQPLPVPYLESSPEVVDINRGRQLFTDDFLIDRAGTQMHRAYHRPVKYSGNPVFFPESPEETGPDFPPCAIAKSGGVWFDDRDQLFKMWYMTGYLGYAALATSEDGIHWKRPAQDVVPGTNLILPKDVHPDSGSVVIDHTAEDPQERYKMLVREPNSDQPLLVDFPGRLFTSADGIHWTEKGATGPMHDRSTMFYNPLKKEWVQSIRMVHPVAVRCRYHFADRNFLKSGEWTSETMIPWLRADCMDNGKFLPAQLYNFDAIAYESILIGFHQILHGPNNRVGEESGLPKLTELYLSTSRDGFHWHRTDRTPFIPARREYGSWEYGYVESSAGMCLIVGDELWIYYSAYAGDPKRITSDWKTNGTYANGAIGLAKLRRDGFVSMRPSIPECPLLTRPLRFDGSRLFINAGTAGSRLSVQVIDAQGKPLPGLSHDDCIGFEGNSTCAEVKWKDRDLRGLGDAKIRLQLRMDRGDLFAFWITNSPDGKSGGYNAAGGPGLTGARDE